MIKPASSQSAAARTPPIDATHDLGTAPPPVLDTVSVLDHRTRLTLLPVRGAPAGRYLEAMPEERDPGVPADPVQPRLIALARPIIHVGRGLIADVRLEDPHVSRRHAIIALRGEGARLLDDRSANGTYLNGRRITVAPLHDGDIVRLGRAVFRYLEIAPARRRGPLRRFPVAPARRGGGSPRPSPDGPGAQCRRGRCRYPTCRPPIDPLHCGASADSRSRPSHAAPRHIRGRRGRGP